jgi:hypothetical protein
MPKAAIASKLLARDSYAWLSGSNSSTMVTVNSRFSLVIA